MAMARKSFTLLCIFLLSALFFNNCQCQERKLHVVYLGDLPYDRSGASLISEHHSVLTNVLGSASLAKQSIVHSYHRSFNGFAAKLTIEEAARLSKMEGVASVFANRIAHPQTTRSWDFMGFTTDKSLQGGPSHGADVIIGVIDTGIWPEHESFDDADLGPPPAKWKGTCKATNFTCNKKIIGARYYSSAESQGPDVASPRDTLGHGTHVSSTIAGRPIKGASYLGLAPGVARGGVPNARVAMYKVCWNGGCDGADILKAFDDAIADGVDILSVSLGMGNPVDYFTSSTAIGSFHAMKHGILTSTAAGNSGPLPATVDNYSPWSLTVAASTIDRKFITPVVLGNGLVINGLAVNNFDLTGNGTHTYPLIWGGDAPNYTGGYDPYGASFCLPGAVNDAKVEGKIVFCSVAPPNVNVLLPTAAGTIIARSRGNDVAVKYPFPASAISEEDGVKLLDYIKNTENPVATIAVADTSLKDTSAPIVASFSSRGPNPISPDILKPDITAPGVDILAAWSPMAPPTAPFDKRSLMYNVMSGTSMATPHATAAAAYVKAAHPDWSPAAIKSALMTTSFNVDPGKHPDLEFAYGAGHINPVGAVDPGLIFDADENDYVKFLCKQGYNVTNLRIVSGDSSTCEGITPGRGWGLNYPTMALYLADGQRISAVFTRTVTNVDKPSSTYHATIYLPESSIFKVIVEPSALTFSSFGEKKSFTVLVTGPEITQQPITSGAVVWEDGTHQVKMPLVVYNYKPGAPWF